MHIYMYIHIYLYVYIHTYIHNLCCMHTCARTYSPYSYRSYTYKQACTCVHPCATLSALTDARVEHRPSTREQQHTYYWKRNMIMTLSRSCLEEPLVSTGSGLRARGQDPRVDAVDHLGLTELGREGGRRDRGIKATPTTAPAANCHCSCRWRKSSNGCTPTSRRLA